MVGVTIQFHNTKGKSLTKQLNTLLENLNSDNFQSIKLESFSVEELVNTRNYIFNNKTLFENNIWAIYLWGKIEKQLKMPDAALNCFLLCLQIENNHIESLRELGFLYAESGRLENAVEYFNKIVNIDKNDWAAWNDGGCSLRAMNKTNEAIKWMKEAAKHNETHAVLYANIATLLYEIHEYDETQEYLNKAFAIDINQPEALHTQAMLFGSLGDHQKCLEYELKTLELKPDYPHAKLGLALAHLALGNLEDGFAGYEHRWTGSDKADTKIMVTLQKPQWVGQRVDKYSFLAVMPEQGFGDMVQFAQLIPRALDKFHTVFWFVPFEMYRLIHHNFNSQNIIVNHDISAVDNKKIDYETPIMSIPLALGINLENINATPKYLKANDIEIEKWKNKLENIKGLKVGIAWTGKPTLGKQKLRSVEPELLSILNQKNISFISLQKFDKNIESNKPNLDNFYDYMDECNDFMDTAALIENLDLVISVDTVIVHLAAALGKPTWLFNRLGSEWRWMDNKTTSPWYPTMKIYNQTKLGDWSFVLELVRNDLVEFGC
ncbi:MAG: hypothetical protein RL154_357 [Pseudomonadota bacterium]